MDVSGIVDTNHRADYSIDHCRGIMRDIFRLLIERRFGATDNVVILHVLANEERKPGVWTLRETYKAVGRLTTFLETTLLE
jgi:hypothetical protein